MVESIFTESGSPVILCLRCYFVTIFHPIVLTRTVYIVRTFILQTTGYEKSIKMLSGRIEKKRKTLT